MCLKLRCILNMCMSALLYTMLHSLPQMTLTKKHYVWLWFYHMRYVQWTANASQLRYIHHRSCRTCDIQLTFIWYIYVMYFLCVFCILMQQQNCIDDDYMVHEIWEWHFGWRKIPGTHEIFGLKNFIHLQKLIKMTRLTSTQMPGDRAR